MTRTVTWIAAALAIGACAPSESPSVVEPVTDQPAAAVPAPAEERPIRSAASSSEQPPAAESWRRCGEQLVASIRAYPLTADGEQTTLGARIDAGAIADAVDGLSPASTQGTWYCIGTEASLRIQYRALINNIEFGPEWTTPRPDRLEPANLLAEAVLGTWQPAEGAEDAVRNAMLDCRAGQVPVTSGAFIRIMNDEGRPATATDLRWTILPHQRDGADELYRAVLGWPTSGGRAVATWAVSPSRSRCRPLDDEAQTMTELAAGVPSHRTALPSGSPTPGNRPFAQPSERGRALAYAFAEQRELATVADWLEFHSRLQPYETGEWEVSGRTDPDGTREVSLPVSRRGGAVAVTYRVNIASGETSPDSVAAELARGVLPRRVPGVGSVSELPTRLTREAIDSVVAVEVDAIGACVRTADQPSAQMEWSIAWDGHTYGLSMSPADDDLVECVNEVLADLRFPRFSGPPIVATSQLTVAQ